MPALGGKTVVLGVTGGISAYKAAETCRLLRKAGADVRVVMTRAATKFITPLTLQTLSGHPVARNLFDPAEEAQIGHIQLADQADLVLVAPATADVIARLAGGHGGRSAGGGGAGHPGPGAAGAGDEREHVGEPADPGQPAPAAGRRPDHHRRPRQGRAGLRLDRRRPPGGPGGDRRGRGADPGPAPAERRAGRAPGGGDGRPHARGGRRRPLPGQPVVGEDGLRAGGGRRPAGRGGDPDRRAGEAGHARRGRPADRRRERAGDAGGAGRGHRRAAPTWW